MRDGVVHNRVDVAGKRGALQTVRLEERARLHGVVGLFQKEVGHTLMG